MFKTLKGKEQAKADILFSAANINQALDRKIHVNTSYKSRNKIKSKKFKLCSGKLS